MFLNHLRVEASGKRWKLINNPLYYRTGEGDDIIVPLGFVTDLASIPAPFRIFFRVHDRHSPAAVVHDYLCRQRGYVVNSRKFYTSEQAHRIFYEAMLELRVPKARAWLMYKAVLLGGPKWTEREKI